MSSTMQDVQLRYDAAIKWLEDNEWKEWKVPSIDSCDRQWFKAFPGEPMCKLNEPKPLQLRVALWDHRKHGEQHFGLEVDLHAEPPSEDCAVSFKAYAFGGVEQVPAACDVLLRAWRAACSPA